MQNNYSSSEDTFGALGTLSAISITVSLTIVLYLFITNPAKRTSLNIALAIYSFVSIGFNLSFIESFSSIGYRRMFISSHVFGELYLFGGLFFGLWKCPLFISLITILIFVLSWVQQYLSESAVRILLGTFGPPFDTMVFISFLYVYCRSRGTRPRPSATSAEAKEEEFLPQAPSPTANLIAADNRSYDPTLRVILLSTFLHFSQSFFAILVFRREALQQIQTSWNLVSFGISFTLNMVYVILQNPSKEPILGLRKITDFWILIVLAIVTSIVGFGFSFLIAE